MGGSTNFIVLSFKVDFHDMFTLGVGIYELWWGGGVKHDFNKNLSIGDAPLVHNLSC